MHQSVWKEKLEFWTYLTFEVLVISFKQLASQIPIIIKFGDACAYHTTLHYGCSLYEQICNCENISLHSYDPKCSDFNNSC